MRRSVLPVLIVVLLGLAAALTPTAQAFSGAWNSTDEPPTIKDPELDAGGIKEGTFAVFPEGEENKFCPSSWAVTFEDPSGSVTETMQDTIDDFGFCVRSATQSMIGTPDFTVTSEDGLITIFRLDDSASPGESPFLYVVTNATGSVIAQGPYTEIHGTFRINSGNPNFETVCLDEHLTLYTDPSTEVIYCLNTETLDEAGWPVAPVPESPSPSVPEPSTSPGPSSKPATPAPIVPATKAPTEEHISLPKPKALTRRQKLAKALKVCKQESRYERKRTSCKKRAEKKYGPRKQDKRLKGSVFWATSANTQRAWCTVRASYNSYYEDYDVYVHSNQPYRDAQVWQKGHDVYGYKTNSEGYADVYVFAEDVNAREGISIRVGRARCSGRL